MGRVIIKKMGLPRFAVFVRSSRDDRTQDACFDGLSTSGIW
jgi:hypothetical protein